MALSWVPATAHCQLEALGVDVASCTDGCHESAADSGDKPGCGIVEGGLYNPGNGALKVPPAPAAPCACWTCLNLAESEDDTGPIIIASVQADRVREWVPAWPFERRAAAPAHAPDSSIA